MRYFDRFVYLNFRKDENANTVYFPYGSFGKGVIIPNERIEKDLRKFCNRLYIINTLIFPIFFAIIMGFVHGFDIGRNYSTLWIFLLFAVLYFAIAVSWIITKHRKLLRGLQKIDRHKTISLGATPSERWPLADKLNLGAILFFLFISVILLFLAPLIMSNTAFIVSALVFWLSVICVIIFVQMWHYKIGATMRK